MLIGVIAVDNVIHAFQQVSLAAEADVIELRLDYLDEWDLDALRLLLNSIDKPVITTIRKKNQGGQCALSQENLIIRIAELASLEPDYLDIEIDIPVEFAESIKKKYPNIQLICSCHVMQETPEDLDSIWQSMQAPCFDHYKLICHAKTVLDAARLLCWAKEKYTEQPLTCFAMGDMGYYSRLIAPVLGSKMHFAVVANKSQIVPGQLMLHDALEIYHVKKLDQDTRLFALLGDPVEHSMGHIVHNSVNNAQNLNAAYLKIKLKPDELPTFLDYAKQLPLYGFSITAPLKQTIVPLLADLSKEAKQIGAVNTVVRERDVFLGFNTDGVGALDAVETQGLVRGKRVLILGAGGAARSIIFEALNRGAHVTCVNRTFSKAKQLANGLNCEAMPMESLKQEIAQFHILINTIPSQLSVIGFMLPKEALKHLEVVMDCNYVPHETALLRQAKRSRVQTVYGIEMFANQALAQMDIWFGEQMDRASAKKDLFRLLDQQTATNIK